MSDKITRHEWFSEDLNSTLVVSVDGRRWSNADEFSHLPEIIVLTLDIYEDEILSLANRLAAAERRERDVLGAIRDTRFMDPPDGGDPTPAEMVRTMREMLERAERERDEAYAWIASWCAIQPWQIVEECKKNAPAVRRALGREAK